MKDYVVNKVGRIECLTKNNCSRQPTTKADDKIQRNTIAWQICSTEAICNTLSNKCHSNTPQAPDIILMYQSW